MHAYPPRERMADLNQNVEKQALQPLASSVPSGSATGRSISELIAAAQHTAAVQGQQLAHGGIFNVQMIPAGTAAASIDPAADFNTSQGI